MKVNQNDNGVMAKRMKKTQVKKSLKSKLFQAFHSIILHTNILVIEISKSYKNQNSINTFKKISIKVALK